MNVMRVLTRKKQEIEEPKAPVLETPTVPPAPKVETAEEEPTIEDKYRQFDAMSFTKASEDGMYHATVCNILLAIHGELKKINERLKQ